MSVSVASAEGRIVRPSVPTVTTQEQLAELVRFYSDQDEVVIDIETVGDHRIDPLRNSVLWIALASYGRTDVIPMGHLNGDLIETRRGLLPSGLERIKQGKPLRKNDLSSSDKNVVKVFSDPPDQLTPHAVLNALEPVLFSPDRRIIAHNADFDLRSLSKYYNGQIPGVVLGDTIMAAFLLNDLNQHQLNLAACVKRVLGYSMEKGVGAEVEKYSFDEVARYCHLDAKMTWLLWRELSSQLTARKAWNLFGLEMDLLKVTMEMEQTGVLVDTDAMRVLQIELETGIHHAVADAYRAAGTSFNINSTADKQKMLFTPAGRDLTPVITTAKTGAPSTSAEALEHFPDDPLCQALLKVSELKKLESTYVVPYLGGDIVSMTSGKVKTEHRDSLLVNGRVHTRFKSFGASTGRMSSTSPNLQNIPSRGTYGRRIRDMFIADPGHKIIQADYSQIEPRVIAALSREPAMLESYAQGKDIYTTLAEPLGLTRDAGKTLVLALSYGVGPKKVASSLGISEVRARRVLNDFSDMFPTLMEFKAATVEQARKRRPVPYARTVLGRRRHLPDLISRDKERRSRAERQAFNALIQGSAADILKIALVRAYTLIPPTARMLLTVHDEILILAPEDVAQQTGDALKEAMEGVHISNFDVPLLAEIHIVDRWGECK